MKRPILIITLGFILGIIWGLYFNIVSFVFLVTIFIVVLIVCIKTRSINNIFRIVNIFIKNNIIVTLLISVLLSNLYLLYSNNKYERIYNKFSEEEIMATVISNNKETEYKNTYKIKLEEYNGINFLLRISKNKKIEIEYGDKIKVNGKYVVPEKSRNYGGFNYKTYLKTKKIYGIYEADSVNVIQNNNLSKIEIISNKIKQNIINGINKILPEDTNQLFLGILIGYDDNLDEGIEESFRKSNLTHLLAVSGAHIIYIITGLNFLFVKLKIHKDTRNILISIFLIFFMYITDFSSSVVRASIMGIIMLNAMIFYRKNDIQNSISTSILLILIDNPYKILDIGLLLSYFATIGIICFSKLHNNNNKNITILERIVSYLRELTVITIFANIFIIPIMVYNFNTISFTFVIANLIAGILIGPITIGGFILIIILIVNLKFAYVISIPYNALLRLLIYTAKIISIIPLSEIFITTPSIIIIFIYYFLLFFFILYTFLKRKYFHRYLVKKISKYIQKILKLLKTNLKIILIFIILLIFIISFILKIIPKDLKIYFIDVGQGDSTLIITPTNKKILIDSGGAETSNFDVGENILFPYLLDRGIAYLDYICISHFDSDHCQGFIYLLNNMKIKNIIISKQYESTTNFKEIMKIAESKNINILKVEDRNILQIDKYVKLKILSPGKTLSDDINDNSLVMQLRYYNFSFLFTGDISKGIEQKLVKEYGNSLKSDILKVAHHGSKTSSDESFMQVVNPKICLIGVGKNNKFGHPNEEVVKELEDINSRIYRTDINGEISLRINKKRKY